MSKYIKIKTTPCPEGHYQLKDEEGNIIESGTIASGQATDIVAPDGNVIVKKSDGSILKVDTVHSAGSKDINIADSIISLRDTGGSLLTTINVKAEETANLVAPDAKVINTDLTYDEDVASGSTLTLPDITVTDSDGSTLTVPAMEDVVCTPQIPLVDGVVDIRDTDNTLIGSQNVANNSTEDFIVPDSLITLKDTDGLTLQTESLKATQPLDLIAPDATVNITNSDNDLLGSVVVPSGSVDDFEVLDSVINVNTHIWNVASTDPLNITIEDVNGNPVVTTRIGNVITIPLAPCEDATYEIKDNSGNILYSGNISSGGHLDQVIGDSTVSVKDSGGNTLGTVSVDAEGNSDFTVANSIVNIDGLQWSVLATDNLGLSVVDAPNGNVVPTTQNGYEVVITGARDIRIDILFEETHDMTCEIEIDSQTASTITSMTETGSSGTITFLLNNVVTTAPFTLAIGDKIRAFRTDTSVDGTIRLTGTF